MSEFWLFVILAVMFGPLVIGFFAMLFAFDACENREESAGSKCFNVPAYMNNPKYAEKPESIFDGDKSVSKVTKNNSMNHYKRLYNKSKS